LVVSNTSPLNYLIQIGAIDLLPRIHQEIHVPVRVIEELLDPAAPDAVNAWAGATPSWLKIDREERLIPGSLAHLHSGEAAAIALSIDRSAALLLIDDLDGRVAARASGLVVMGTLGVLDAAACLGLADFHSLLDALLGTNFRAPRTLVETLRERHS
jgi:predicted nucleic acid-binding protein